MVPIQLFRPNHCSPRQRCAISMTCRQLKRPRRAEAQGDAFSEPGRRAEGRPSMNPGLNKTKTGPVRCPQPQYQYQVRSAHAVFSAAPSLACRTRDRTTHGTAPPEPGCRGAACRTDADRRHPLLDRRFRSPCARLVTRHCIGQRGADLAACVGPRHRCRNGGQCNP